MVIFGRMDIAMQTASIDLRSIDIFVNVREPPAKKKEQKSGAHQIPSISSGKGEKESRTILSRPRRSCQVGDPPLQEQCYSSDEEEPPVQNERLPGRASQNPLYLNFIERLKRYHPVVPKQKSPMQNIYENTKYYTRPSKASSLETPPQFPRHHRGRGVLERKEKPECPFLKFLNLRDSFAHLFYDFEPEDKLQNEGSGVESDPVNKSFSQEPETQTLDGQVERNLNSLSRIETVDIFTNFNESSNSHIVNLLVNSSFNFFAKASSLEDALRKAKSMAFEFFQQLDGEDPKWIPASSKRDLGLLLQLVESRTTISPQHLPITFEFDFEKRSWKSTLNMKDCELFHSEVFKSKADSIRDVLLKYLSNTFGMKSF